MREQVQTAFAAKGCVTLTLCLPIIYYRRPIAFVSCRWAFHGHSKQTKLGSQVNFSHGSVVRPAHLTNMPSSAPALPADEYHSLFNHAPTKATF